MDTHEPYHSNSHRSSSVTIEKPALDKDADGLEYVNGGMLMKVKLSIQCQARII